LQGETPGQVKPLDVWYPIDAATMSFGQGILVTPMQLMRAFSAVINGGNLMRPYVVKGLKMDIIKFENLKYNEEFSVKTSDIMRKMLVDTVNKKQSGIFLKVLLWWKTGTAQIAFDGKYDSQNNRHL
jgi:cell division protein FtsI/penicillin-binding protein 2